MLDLNQQVVATALCASGFHPTYDIIPTNDHAGVHWQGQVQPERLQGAP